MFSHGVRTPWITLGYEKCDRNNGGACAYTDLIQDYPRTPKWEILDKNVETTMIYTHVLNRGGRGVHSPLDRLRKPMGIERADLSRPAGRPNTAEVS